MFISSAFAQTAPAAADAGGGMMSSLTSMLPLVLMFVVLYFVMIRPQMKKQKEHRAMIDALAKGDEVATAGGLLGKVTQLSDGYMSLEISSGVDVMLIDEVAATEMSSDGELLHRSTSPATTVPPAIRETTVSAKVHFSARFKSVCSFDTYPRSHRHGSPPMRVASGIPVAITAISVTNRMVSYRAGSV